MQLKIPENIIDYLRKRSSDRWNLEWNISAGIEVAVVVPAICEFENIKLLIESLCQNEKSNLAKTLVIFIINNSVSSDSEIKQDNQNSIEYLRKVIVNISNEPSIGRIMKSGIRIGLIDAASAGKEFQDKDAGVGLARKTGMDAALSAFDYSIPGSKILISLDADCIVEQNYLEEIIQSFTINRYSVANVNFEHNLTDIRTETLGIISYEIFLRHYIAGLYFAQSPFAFHTVGSTVVCEYEAYVKVEGMNKRKAAEDFYFLQKLAKHYKINRIDATKVKPSARKSWRVPFGTGRSIADLASNKKNILLYNADVFNILKNWLRLFYSDLSLDLSLIQREAERIHPELANFLQKRGFGKDWRKILDHCKNQKQLNYQRKNYFDAFETLKLIHHLRDTSFPMMDISSGIKKLFHVTQHSLNFDLQNDRHADLVRLYASYLSELKLLELSLYKLSEK
jgi:hypothetical protein